MTARFVGPGESPEACLAREIDFDRLNVAIEEFRAASLDYLKSALGVAK